MVQILVEAGAFPSDMTQTWKQTPGVGFRQVMAEPAQIPNPERKNSLYMSPNIWMLHLKTTKAVKADNTEEMFHLVET